MSPKKYRRLMFAVCFWFVVMTQPGEVSAGPVIVAAATAAISNLTISAVLASIVKSLIASAILGGLGSLLSKKPKSGGGDAADTSRTQMVKEAISPRQIILGRTRVSGAITYLNTFDNHKRAEMCITFAGHPCDAVEQVYLDDRLCTIDANGKVTDVVDRNGKVDDTWINNCTVKIGLGTAQTDAAWLSYAQGQTAGEWTALHTQTGCSKIWLTFKLSDKPGGNSLPNVSFVVRGLCCIDPRLPIASPAWTQNPALLLRQYLILTGIVEADASTNNDTRTIAAANICDEIVAGLGVAYNATRVWSNAGSLVTADTALDVQTGNILTFAAPPPFVRGDAVNVSVLTFASNPPMTRLPSSLNAWTTYYVWYGGIGTQMNLVPSYEAAMGAYYAYNLIDLAGGVGKIRVTKSVASQYYNAVTLTLGAASRLKTGEVVRLTSTGTFPTGLSAGVDYYVILVDVANDVISFAATLNEAMAGAAITLTSVGSGTLTVSKTSEIRYTCNGALRSDQQPIDAIPDILSSMMGTLSYIGGKWSVTAGSYTTPTITFDENDLDGSPSSSFAISMRDNFNSIKGTYFSPTAYYEQDSFPAIINNTYINEDGTQSWNTISLPMTNSPSMCQRIAKALLEGIRQGITTSWPMKLTALQVQVGDIVYLNRTRLGWVNKPFQVTTWQFVTRGDGSNLRLGIDVTFREVAPAQYAWNSGEETLVDLSPNTNLPSAFSVTEPGAPIVTERDVLTNDSQSVKSVVDISWDASTTSSVTQYQVEYKPSADTIWNILPLQSGEAQVASVYGLNAGSYDFRVKAINNLGAYSEYSPVTTAELLAGLAPPSAVTGITLQEVSSLGILRWDLHPGLSVRIAGSIHIRHSDAGIGGANLANSVEIIPAVAGNANTAVVPLKSGTYLLYAKNAAGVLSLTPALIASSNATVLPFATVSTIQEDPIFPGVNSGTTVDSGAAILKLLGTGLWDSIPNFDIVPDIDDYGGTTGLTGTYNFATGVDLLTVQKVKLVTRLQVLMVNTSNLIDSRTADIDDWPDFDGIAPGIIANAQIQVRYTADDPSGSPTWGAWNWLVNADYEARGFQFRVVLTVSDPAYNVYISQLGVTILQL